MGRSTEETDGGKRSMKKFDKGFLLGASTAAHQVEGNNTHSDFWAMEQMEYSSFDEPSLDAVDHYHHFKEDIDLMAGAGLNAYRFSIEWARIEPEHGKFDESEIAHYREVLEYCREKGIEPVVTMHHFSSPKWLIEEGGWENEETIGKFADYCAYTVRQLGSLMQYVCTINEANMGIQMAAITARYAKMMQSSENSNLQVGVNLGGNAFAERMQKQAEENQKVFGTVKPETFLSGRTKAGDEIIMQAHQAAKTAMKQICPELKVGLTLSLHDIQPLPGGEALAKKEWEEEFLHYLPYLREDDFFGLQNYTRTLIGKEGTLPVPKGTETTQMGYEFYPQALGHVIRTVYQELKLPILVTENGIGTADDKRRIAFIEEALKGVAECKEDKIPVIGYLHWSLLDNFEWQKGFSRTFGLIAVDRTTQKRYPKESLGYLGQFCS